MDLKVKHPMKARKAYYKARRQEKRQKADAERQRKTRLAIGIIVLLAVLAIPAIFVNSAFGYLPVVAAALLFILSYLYVLALRRSLVFEENSDFNNCIRGCASAFSIRVKNRSPLVFSKLEVSFYISDLFGGEDDVTSTVVTLAPFEERTFAFDIEFAHIGTYEAGLQKVTMQDLFGFFQKTLPNTSRYSVQVAPKVFDLADLHISDRALSESRNMLKPVSVEGNDYTGVREYVIGDPIKNIHWKLSARTSGYMTRQFESYGSTGITIIIDLLCPLYDRDSMMSVFDGVVETALSAEAYAKKNGMEAEILYLDKHGARKQYITRPRTNSFTLIADLPKITAEKKKSNDAIALLRLEGSGAWSRGNIAFITGRVTAQLTRTLMDVKSRKKSPILFVVLPARLEGEERKKYLKPLRALDYAQIPYYVVCEAEELQGGERRVS